MRTRWMALAGVALAGAVHAAPVPDGFATATGKVSYTVDGGMKGKTTVTWTDSGRKFRQDISGKVAASGKAISGWTICDGKFIYRHDQSMGKQVARQEVPKGNGGGIPLIGISKGTGKVVGKETLLGKPCEIREIGGTRISVWQNLPLKMVAQVQNGTSFSFTATELKTAVPVTPTMFQVPAGMQVSQPKMQRLPAPGAPQKH